MTASRVSRRQAGFTLLELVIVVCVVGVSATFVMDRLWRYQEMAEKAAISW